MRRIQPSTSDARDARASEGTETVFTLAPTRRGACNTIRDVRRCERRRESPLFKTPRASKPSVWRRRVVCVVTHPRNRARLAALAVAERERERASPRRIPAAPSARTRRRRASRAVARVQRESGMRTPPRGCARGGSRARGGVFARPRLSANSLRGRLVPPTQASERQRPQRETQPTRERLRRDVGQTHRRPRPDECVVEPRPEAFGRAEESVARRRRSRREP